MIRPPHVMLAWEHGRNFGHAARLLTIADELMRQGAVLTWAIPAHEHSAPWFEQVTNRFVACPVIQRDDTQPKAVQSFADILMSLGFADPDRLQVAVCAWLAMFENQAIDRVVLDYAPAAQLAAFIAGLPAAQITSGFEAPPAECPVFGIALRGPMIDKQNARKVQTINRCIAMVCKRLGGREPVDLGKVLAYPARWYDCIPATDPYGPRTDGTYIGPTGNLGAIASVVWPPGPPGAKKVFVYLRNIDQLALVLEALEAKPHRVLCVLPGASESELGRLRRDGVNIAPAPVDLDVVLPEADLVATYGAVATATKALLLGKPQLILPTEVDKYLVAKRIAEYGNSRVFWGKPSASVLTKAMDELHAAELHTPECRSLDMSRFTAEGALPRVCTVLLVGATKSRKHGLSAAGTCWQNELKFEALPIA